jgi:hypothetical protein
MKNLGLCCYLKPVVQEAVEVAVVHRNENGAVLANTLSKSSRDPKHAPEHDHLVAVADAVQEEAYGGTQQLDSPASLLLLNLINLHLQTNLGSKQTLLPPWMMISHAHN